MAEQAPEQGMEDEGCLVGSLWQVLRRPTGVGGGGVSDPPPHFVQASAHPSNCLTPETALSFFLSLWEGVWRGPE